MNSCQSIRGFPGIIHFPGFLDILGFLDIPDFWNIAVIQCFPNSFPCSPGFPDSFWGFPDSGGVNGQNSFLQLVTLVFRALEMFLNWSCPLSLL